MFTKASQGFFVSALYDSSEVCGVRDVTCNCIVDLASICVVFVVFITEEKTVSYAWF